jgi:predicted nucleotidyltransferase
MKPEMTDKIADFFQDRHEVNAVYVFGSYARGREQRDSDLDLAILLSHNAVDERSKLKTEYTIHLSRILRKDLHLIIMNDAGEEIIAQVFKYGQCIFNRKPELLSRFRMVSYAMIAEFGYLRNKMKQGFVRGVFGESR